MVFADYFDDFFCFLVFRAWNKKINIKVNINGRGLNYQLEGSSKSL